MSLTCVFSSPNLLETPFHDWAKGDMSKFLTDWFKNEGAKDMSEKSKSARAEEKRLLSRPDDDQKAQFDVGVPDVTARVRLKNFPKDISEDTVRRAFQAGDLPSEERENDHEPYCISVNSYPPVDPNVDLRGIKGISDAANKSPRQMIRMFQDPNSDFPFDKLFGRYYSCQSSVDNWKKK